MTKTGVEDLIRNDENYLRVSFLRDHMKSSRDLDQHLAALSGRQVDPSTV